MHGIENEEEAYPFCFFYWLPDAAGWEVLKQFSSLSLIHRSGAHNCSMGCDEVQLARIFSGSPFGGSSNSEGNSQTLSGYSLLVLTSYTIFISHRGHLLLPNLHFLYGWQGWWSSSMHIISGKVIQVRDNASHILLCWMLAIVVSLFFCLLEAFYLIYTLT